MATTAYDRKLYLALRAQPVFELVADVKPAYQAMPGTSVVFTIMNDLSQATSTLSQGTDVTAVALATTSVTVTLSEYGNAVTLEAALRATGFIDVDEATINVLGYNMVDSLDAVAFSILNAGNNVRYGGGRASRATVTSADTIVANDIRNVVAALRRGKALPKKDTYYIGYVHPDVSYDVRTQTSGSPWRDAHIYSSPDAIYAGEIGAFESVVFIESPRLTIVADAGSSPTTTDIYQTLICGQQALARAAAIDPHIVQSPVVDRLRRELSFGWYTLLGYSIFRQAALWRIETSSSIAANTTAGTN